MFATAKKLNSTVSQIRIKLWLLEQKYKIFIARLGKFFHFFHFFFQLCDLSFQKVHTPRMIVFETLKTLYFIFHHTVINKKIYMSERNKKWSNFKTLIHWSANSVCLLLQLSYEEFFYLSLCIIKRLCYRFVLILKFLW